jgi:hypothetical protein
MEGFAFDWSDLGAYYSALPESFIRERRLIMLIHFGFPFEQQ